MNSQNTNIQEQKNKLESLISEKQTQQLQEQKQQKVIQTSQMVNAGIDIKKCLLKYLKYEVYQLQYNIDGEVKLSDTYMFVQFSIKDLFMVELYGENLTSAFKTIINNRLNRK